MFILGGLGVFNFFFAVDGNEFAWDEKYYQIYKSYDY